MFDMAVRVLGNTIWTKNKEMRAPVMKMQIPSLCLKVINERPHEISAEIVKNFVWFIKVMVEENYLDDKKTIEDSLAIQAIVAAQILEKNDEEAQIDILMALKGIASKAEYEKLLVTEHQGVYFVSFAADCLKSKNI